MKEKPIMAGENAPVDSIEVVDEKQLKETARELHDRISYVRRDLSEEDENTRRAITQLYDEFKHKFETLAIVGSVVAGALCFVMIMRREK